MSKRNFILLIIILTITTLVVFGVLYFQKAPTTPTGDTSGTNFFSQFNPFGTGKPKPTTTQPTVDVSGYVPPDSSTETLSKVSSMPVAGFAIFSKERLKEVATAEVDPKKVTPPQTEFVPALRYVAKENGNIYQTFADKINERKFSTTIIPRVYDAYFGSNAGLVIMRYLKQNDRIIETFMGSLPKELLGVESGTNEIKGSFLPDNVKDISISPDTSKALYLFNSGVDSSDNMVGTILNFGDGKKTQVLDSPFTEWLSQWAAGNVLTFTTKPSSSVPGYMYTTDTTGKNFTRTLGNINGLTTLAGPTGKLVLVGNSSLLLSIYHTDTMVSDQVALRTLPEKCVWNKIGDSIYCAVPKIITPQPYPDTWYQGEVSFNDQIWKIDVKTDNATLLLDPQTIMGGEGLDGIKLAVDEGENYLLFVNKKDSYLWKLNLK